MPKIDSRPPFLRLFELFGFTFNLDGENAHAEECLFCGKSKFYLNTSTGQYKCHSENECGAQGNAYTFIRCVHQTSLERTTDEDYRRLKDIRNLPLQTLKRHDLAWNEANSCWLIPFKSNEGEVLNLTRFWEESGDKWYLPGLPLRLYGLDKLSSHTDRTMFICEGPFDAMALDQHLVSNKSRNRYDILAVPAAVVFQPEWLEYLKGRTVRLCLDNDPAGRKGQERIAKFCRDRKIDCKLSALAWPYGFPEGGDIDDLVKDGVNVVEFTREHCVKVSAGERRILFVRGDKILKEKTKWMWDHHIPFGTFVSLSGEQGTQKSTIAKDLAARGTAGLPMPECQDALAPFDVMFFTSEDSASQVRDLVSIHGGNLERLHVNDIASSLDLIDLLECLDEIEAGINARKVRLVVLDALNSFVGGDISSDSKARRTLTGRLHTLARRTGACIIGIRNWGRMEGGTASQRALGATSLSHVARCVMNTCKFETKKGSPPQYQLEFEKVSGANPLLHLPIPYTVEDLSTCKEDSHRRKILWEKEVAQKGS